jgi:hypothetical protein
MVSTRSISVCVLLLYDVGCACLALSVVRLHSVASIVFCVFLCPKLPW